MNERIKELLEQAGVKYVTMPKDTVYEKFAELIVAECAEVLLKWKGEPFPFDEDLAVRLIKENFGFKE